MTEHRLANPPALPRAVVRRVAGALPAEALALLAGPVGEAVAQAAGYAGQALSENTRRVASVAGSASVPIAEPIEFVSRPNFGRWIKSRHKAKISQTSHDPQNDEHEKSRADPILNESADPTAPA